jgi:hypothetical protein
MPVAEMRSAPTASNHLLCLSISRDLTRVAPPPAVQGGSTLADDGGL